MLTDKIPEALADVGQAAGDELRLVPLKSIRPWPNNPRKVFNEEKLANLAVSIGAEGVLQPIVLREIETPASSKKPRNEALGVVRYEIVCGERRYRAAEIAGLKVIPAIVRILTDVQVLAIAIIENEQREDISPMEKALGYQTMIKIHGVKIDDVAARVGKSASSIRAALRLMDLPGNARQALNTGQLPPSIAELVAARPSIEMRQKVADYALAIQTRYSPNGRREELPSLRMVKDYIAQECMIELKQAPFGLKDEGLGIAGPCTTCPKRSGNNRELYPDGRADLCTDPHCYRDKIKAHAEKLKAAAAADGTKVLAEAEAKKLFPHGNTLAYDAPYFDLAAQCYEAKRVKDRAPSYKYLLDQTKEKYEMVLCEDGTGQLCRLVHKDVAVPLLRKHYGLFKHDSGRGSIRSNEEQKREAARQRREAAIERRARALVLEAGAAGGRKMFDSGCKLSPDAADLLRLVASFISARLSTERRDEVLKRRNIKVSRNYLEMQKQVAAMISQCDRAGVLELVAELLTADQVLTYSVNDIGKRVEQLLNLDLRAAKKAAAAELAETAAPKTKLTKTIERIKKRRKINGTATATV